MTDPVVRVWEEWGPFRQIQVGDFYAAVQPDVVPFRSIWAVWPAGSPVPLFRGINWTADGAAEAAVEACLFLQEFGEWIGSTGT